MNPQELRISLQSYCLFYFLKNIINPWKVQPTLLESLVIWNRKRLNKDSPAHLTLPASFNLSGKNSPLPGVAQSTHLGHFSLLAAPLHHGEVVTLEKHSAGEREWRSSDYRPRKSSKSPNRNIGSQTRGLAALRWISPKNTPADQWQDASSQELVLQQRQNSPLRREISLLKWKQLPSLRPTEYLHNYLKASCSYSHEVLNAWSHPAGQWPRWDRVWPPDLLGGRLLTTLLFQ